VANDGFDSETFISMHVLKKFIAGIYRYSHIDLEVIKGALTGNFWID
jgi:hypothetical protein